MDDAEEKQSTPEGSADQSAPVLGEGARDADFSKLEREREGSKAGDVNRIEKLEDEVIRLQTELSDVRDKYLRSVAESDNIRKRHAKERSELLRYQGDRLVLELLPVLDNLERASAHLESDPAKIKQGLELICKLFVDALAKWEIRSESALGVEFDPQKHQAISKVWVDDARPGTVISELKKAYFYKDRILRHGEVVVATEARPESDAEAQEGSSVQNEERSK